MQMGCCNRSLVVFERDRMDCSEDNKEIARVGPLSTLMMLKFVVTAEKTNITVGAATLIFINLFVLGACSCFMCIIRIKCRLLSRKTYKFLGKVLIGNIKGDSANCCLLS